MSKKTRWIVSSAIVVAVAAAGAWYLRDTTGAEAERLATILDWKSGRTIAEVGAGKGEMTVLAAQRVGPSGHVFSTELDPKRLRDIEAAVAKQHLTDVTVIRAAEADTHLPPDCCDAIFMRGVYHHFAHPTEIDASLLRALRPGGLLAVIDFAPNPVLSLLARSSTSNRPAEIPALA